MTKSEITDAENSDICQALDQALRKGELGIESSCTLIKAVIERKCWLKRRIRTGEIVELKSLRELITLPPLHGYGEKPERVEQMLAHDPEALVAFRQAMTGESHRPKKQESGNNITTNGRITGTSKSYTLSRLKSHRPDLFEQVKSGSVSAHAAAIQAGWRKVKTPLEQLEHWWKKANTGEREKFRKWIA